MAIKESGAISALDIKNEFGTPPPGLGYNQSDIPLKEYCWGGYLAYDTALPKFAGEGTNISFNNFYNTRKNWPVSLRPRIAATVNGVNTIAETVTAQNIGNFWSVGCNDYFQLFESGDVATISGISVNYSGLPTTNLVRTAGISSPGFPSPIVLTCDQFSCNLTGQENGVSWCFAGGFFGLLCDYGTRNTSNRNPGIRLYDKDNVLVKEVIASVTSPASGTTSATIPAWSYEIDPTKFPYKVRYRIEVKRMNFNERCADNQSAWGITDLPVFRIAPLTHGFSPIVFGSSVNEGSKITLGVTALGVANGTTLYWTIKHGTTVPADFYSIDGSFTVTDTAGSIDIRPIPERVTEGAQTFQVELRTGSTTGPVQDTYPLITINDTSLDPTYTFLSVPAVIRELIPETLQVNTTEVDNGTILYWTIKNAQTVNADFVATSGTITINDGSGQFSIEAKYDGITETNEKFQIEIRTGSATGTIVATSSYIEILNVNISFRSFPDTSAWTDGYFSYNVNNKPIIISNSANNNNFSIPDGYFASYSTDFSQAGTQTSFVSTGTYGEFQLSSAAGGDFSIDAWIRPRDFSTASVIFSQGSTSLSNGNPIQIGIHKDGRLFFSWGLIAKVNVTEVTATTHTLPAGLVFTSVCQASYGGICAGVSPAITLPATFSATSRSKSEDIWVGQNSATIVANGYTAIFGDPAAGTIKRYSVILSYGIMSDISIKLNQWSHISVTRSGNTITMFIDGQFVGYYDNYTAAQLGGGFSYNSKNTWGAHWQAPGVYTLKYTGQISNYRVVKKTNLQSGSVSYPVPTITPVAPNYGISTDSRNSGAYCVCLLFSTSRYLTTFSDIGLAPTIVNGSSTGGSTGGGITITTAPVTRRDSPAGVFVTNGGDFTIEFFLRFTSLPTTDITLFGAVPTSISTLKKPYGLVIRKPLNNDLLFQMNPTETTSGIEQRIATHSQIAVNTWYHVAVSRKRGYVYTMFNGATTIADQTVASINTFPTPTTNYAIGGLADNLESFSGYISNFRFIRGKAVYISDGTYTSAVVPVEDFNLMDNINFARYGGSSTMTYTKPTQPLSTSIAAGLYQVVQNTDTILLAAKSSAYLDKSSYNNTLTTTSPIASMVVKPIPFANPDFPGAENKQFIVYVDTTNLPSTTPLYWTIKHGTTNAADFTTTSGQINYDGVNLWRFTFFTANDLVVDSANPETYQVEIRYGSITGTVLVTSPILYLWDTSYPAV